jgi:NADH-quinone oxidoreductase subunit D
MSPTRVRLRSPSFANLSAIVYILPGHMIADVVAVLGSLDPVFGDVDR